MKKLKALGMTTALMLIPNQLMIHAEETTASIPVTVEGTESAKVTISSDSEAAMSALVGETTVDVDGETAFEIKYDGPVSYTYTITQVAGDDDSVAYDSNEYQAHVFVESEEDGSLVPYVVTWKTDETGKTDGVKFTNTKEVTPTATPASNKGSADTSDNSNIMEYLAGMGIGALAVILLLLIRKQMNDKKRG